MKCPTCPGETLCNEALELAEGCPGPVLYDASTATDTLVMGPFCRAQTIVDKHNNPKSFVGINIVGWQPEAIDEPFDEVGIKIGRAIAAALNDIRDYREVARPDLTLVDTLQAED